MKAALCGPNPQQVLIYGPPGIGKTCAARLVLEEAKRNPQSPFKHAAKFIEMDATSIRFDERIQGQSIEIIAAERVEEVIEHAIIKNSC